MSIVKLNNVSYSYKKNRIKTILDDISIEFETGKFYAILGQSGSGKTTLLSILAGLDEPVKGEVVFNDKNIKDIGYSFYRKKNVSLIFQNYNLLDYLTPVENLKLVNSKASEEMLLELGLNNQDINRNILHLSGGQQQRVAIARSLVSNAPIILADEPTGNLDENTAKGIIDILKRISHYDDKCVIVVTHSKKLAKQADLMFELKNGKLNCLVKSNR